MAPTTSSVSAAQGRAWSLPLVLAQLQLVCQVALGWAHPGAAPTAAAASAAAASAGAALRPSLAFCKEIEAVLDACKPVK